MKIINNSNNEKNKSENQLPFIPLREIVIFPGMEKNFYVGRKESINAVELSLSTYDKKVFLATQKNSDIENPDLNNLYKVGVIATILETNFGPDKSIIKISIKGLERAIITNIINKDNTKFAIVNLIQEKRLDDSPNSEALLNVIINEFKKFINFTKLSKERIQDIINVENENMLINNIVPLLKITIEKKMALLETEEIEKRIVMLGELITENIELIMLEKKINFEVKKKLDKNQKEYFLNEQLKEIQKELGYQPTEENLSIDDFKKALDKMGMSEIAKNKAIKEQKRLNKMPPLSPETTVIRTYIDNLMELPWSKKSEESKDLNNAKKILDEDHYSLKKVKNRILEFLAVRQLNKKTKGPILCFVGPPGTGKTSLGRSVARAIGREFIRISLGGIRDEAEIRGHRRTYLGALPGKIIQSMKRVKTINPVFLLDEIDKLNSDFRGDPASALLEVLDPEQNNQFTDHYLEIPYDLSEIMFITTANSSEKIPYPLLDRMEIIYISSYTELEKLNIAKKFLIPKEKEENGINDLEIILKEPTILEIIRSYTMEAGVRSLQRQIASICRKIAKRIVVSNKKIEKVVINKTNLIKFLGKKKYIQPVIEKNLDIGVAHGLAWSEIGGSILPIEVVLYPGTGNIILTGKLGEVMKESAQTAFSYIRANAHLFDIKINNFYKDFDVHIHFPEGAIPKDGPSAGIAITCGILSCLTKIPMHSKYALTGEITLTGKVLPIGGLKEKSLAALRHKKEKLLIPYENQKDLEDLPKSVQKRIEFILIKNAMEAFNLVFDNAIFTKKSIIKDADKDINKIDKKIIEKKIISDHDYDNIVTQ